MLNELWDWSKFVWFGFRSQNLVMGNSNKNCYFDVELQT